MNEHRITRVIAYLMREYNISPDQVESSIQSACDMKIGESASLVGDDMHRYRRAFINEQLTILRSCDTTK